MLNRLCTLYNKLNNNIYYLYRPILTTPTFGVGEGQRSTQFLGHRLLSLSIGTTAQTSCASTAVMDRGTADKTRGKADQTADIHSGIADQVTDMARGTADETADLARGTADETASMAHGTADEPIARPKRAARLVQTREDVSVTITFSKPQVFFLTLFLNMLVIQ